jgi:hypothetical protein
MNVTLYTDSLHCEIRGFTIRRASALHRLHSTLPWEITLLGMSYLLFARNQMGGYLISPSCLGSSYLLVR